MMGLGIWSMHFVGMLAFQMSMPVTYGVGLTALSMGVAMLASGGALFLVSQTTVTRRSLLMGGLLMGLAINAMHYLGMMAMRMEATVQYDPLLFVLSVLIAVGASVAALWLAFQLKREQRTWSWRALGSAVLMGAAIAGMHYTGMAAASFTPAPVSSEYISAGLRIGELGATAIGAATLGGLGLLLLSSLIDLERRRSERNLALLVEASALLGRTLDIPTLVETLAGLVAPGVGDGCLVDLYDEDGVTLRRRAVSYPHHRHEEARHRSVCFKRDAASSHPLQRVLRNRQPERLVQLTREALEQLAAAPESLTLLREAQARSALIVPLQHREHLLGVLTVFSSRPRMESTQLALVQELGRRACSALENARLFCEAQEAIRMRDEFLSIASHELNTPLTPLQLHLQRLQRVMSDSSGAQVSSAQVSQVVDVAQRQTRRLARLVHELLDISRIRLGRLELNLEAQDLAEVARDVVARTRAELGPTDSVLTVQAEQPVIGQWDRSRLEQVLGNLLTNAVRFGQGKPVEVTVRAEEGSACLSVRDRGIGIAPEHLQRIFERFERAASRNYGGLGLGLYIVRQIVESHGGTIHVESEPGRGSTFTVKLPRTPELH
jgi:signal transduction histidine kinase